VLKDQRDPLLFRDLNWKSGTIAVLGILGCCALLVVLLARSTGTAGKPDVRCIVDIAKWKNELERYKEITGTYPADDNLLDAAGLQLVIEELYPGTNTTHDLQLRDPWGRPFRYRSDGSKYRYELGSSGEDREMGNAKQGASAFGDGDDITIDNGRM